MSTATTGTGRRRATTPAAAARAPHPPDPWPRKAATPASAPRRRRPPPRRRRRPRRGLCRPEPRPLGWRPSAGRPPVAAGQLAALGAGPAPAGLRGVAPLPRRGLSRALWLLRPQLGLRRLPARRLVRPQLLD